MPEQKASGIYNVVVIGAGTAGLVTAAGTASLGGRVALIERNKMGGDCLNFGCVPSKALISSARLAHNIAHAHDWGLAKQTPKFELEQVFARMRARRAQIAPNDSQERFESLGVDVFRGEARFLSPHEVEVDGTKLRAKNFVIATGTRAAIPPIEGLEGWRAGGLEGWRAGGLEGWRAGGHSILHQRNDLRRAKSDAGKYDRYRRRADRLRIGSGVLPARRGGHAPQPWGPASA
jgi:glycine/D-amino acid oxidase-like deaminating enzyme